MQYSVPLNTWRTKYRRPSGPVPEELKTPFALGVKVARLCRGNTMEVYAQSADDAHFAAQRQFLDFVRSTFSLCRVFPPGGTVVPKVGGILYNLFTLMPP